jgi:cyclase
MRRSVLALLAVAVASAIAAGSVRAQQPQAAAPKDLETLRVQRNVYAIFGAGGNVTVQVGDEGVLIVDSGLAASSTALLAEVRKLSTRPIRFIINTHVHPDHVGGNVGLAAGPPDPRRPPGRTLPTRCSRSTSSRTNAC